MNRGFLFVISLFAALASGQVGIALAQSSSSGEPPATKSLPAECYDASGNLNLTDANRALCSEDQNDSNNPGGDDNDPNTGSIGNDNNNSGTGTGTGTGGTGTGTGGSGDGTSN